MKRLVPSVCLAFLFAIILVACPTTSPYGSEADQLANIGERYVETTDEVLADPELRNDAGVIEARKIAGGLFVELLKFFADILNGRRSIDDTETRPFVPNEPVPDNSNG